MPTKDVKTRERQLALAKHARDAKKAARPLDPGAMRAGRKLLDKKRLLAKVPATFVTINEWIRKDRFPKPYMMGGKAVWWEDEVDEAVHNLLRQE